MLFINIKTKTIEYEYSPYGGIDEIILDIAENIKKGFTVSYIDYSKAISCRIGENYKLVVRFKNINE